MGKLRESPGDPGRDPEGRPRPRLEGSPQESPGQEGSSRTLAGPPCWAVEHRKPQEDCLYGLFWPCSSLNVIIGPFMESAPLWGLVSIGDPYGP